MTNKKFNSLFEKWFDRLSKLAVPVLLGGFGLYYSELQRERADVQTVIGLITAEDDLTKNLGASYAVELSDKNRLPTSVEYTLLEHGVRLGDGPGASLVSGLLEKTETPENSKSVVEEAYSKAAEVVLSEGSDSAGFVESGQNPIPARIYFHTQRNAEEQLRPARIAELQVEDLTVAGRAVVVPGIQAVSKTKQHELRCFRSAECDAVEKILPALQKIIKGLTINKNLVSQFENSDKIRPYHYEIWFGPEPIEPNT